MKNVIGFAIAGVLLYSCSNSTPKTGTVAQDPQNNIEITNDMENAAGVIPSWQNEKTVMAIKEPAAHSGEFVSITNDTIEYSYAYCEVIKNISPALPKKINVTGWVYSTVAKPNLAIILDISENNKQYDWKAFPLAETLGEPGKWVQFSGDFYLDKPLNPEQAIKIYAWNQAKKPIYIDDLKISFEF